MSGVLERILATKKTEVERLRGQRLPEPPPRRALGLARGPDEPLRLIAEIKRRSPSAGALDVTLGVGERARAYERGGATMVSVLCDEQFFDGGFAHLAEARRACSLPLLAKEFVIDELQLDAARSYGADAVLVIVRCVAPARLAPLVRAARERDLEPFVEIATEDEGRLALDAGATLVGVNARDLDNLAMDGERAARILAGLPSTIVSVHLSGLATPAAIAKVRRSPAHAALIGEALMREPDPEALLRSFVNATG